MRTRSTQFSIRVHPWHSPMEYIPVSCIYDSFKMVFDSLLVVVDVFEVVVGGC